MTNFCFCKTIHIFLCFRVHTGGELLQADSSAGDAILKQLWHHSDAIMCCSVKANVSSNRHFNFFSVSPRRNEVVAWHLYTNFWMQASAVFTFSNQAGLDMLETTLVALQDIMLDKILDEAGRKILLSEFSKIMQQVLLVVFFLSIRYSVSRKLLARQ